MDKTGGREAGHRNRNWTNENGDSLYFGKYRMSPSIFL